MGGAEAAGRDLVDLGQPLLGLNHVDVLLLEVLGRGGQTTRLEDGRELLLGELPAVVLLAGIAIADYV